MGNFPKIIIPTKFEEVKNSNPPLPKKPIEPFKPKRGENGTFGCLFPIIAVIIFLAFIGQGEIIGSLVIISTVIIGFMYFSKENEINRQFSEAQDRYYQNLEEFKFKTIQWENEKKRLLSNPLIIRNHRENAFKDLLKRTQKADQVFNSQKGYSEVKFQGYLNKYFRGNIYTNQVIEEPFFNRPYQPDFIYKCDKTNLHVDIEVDEPYSLHSGEPIHYETFGISIDNSRDRYFTEKNWIVIRFAEEQVLFYPDECCKIIAQTISDTLGTPNQFWNLSKIGRLKELKQWTKEEAVDMYRKNYRLSLIAEIELREKKESDKSHSINRYNIGIKHYNEKNYLSAISFFTEAIRFNEKHINSFFYRAISLRFLNKYDEAIKDLLGIIKLDPKHHKAFNQIGLCYSLNKKYINAIESYSKAISLSKRSVYFKNRANSYKNIFKYDEAINDYSEYLIDNPKDAVIYNVKGSLNKELGHFELAIKDFTNAIQYSPKTITYINNRGISYLMNQNIEKASIDFNCVVDLNFNDVTSNFYLDFIESTFFGSNLNLINYKQGGKQLTTFTNSFKHFNMALFDYFKKNPLLEKWNQMNEYWKTHFRTEFGFRGTPQDDDLNEIFGTKSLELNMKGLKDISIVSLLPYLEDLSVGWNPINDLSPLKSCLNLNTLIISGTKITDLSSLRSLKNLEEVHLMQVPIEDISPLEGLVNLKHLILAETNVSDLAPIRNLKKLETLNIENTNVTDLSPLYGLTNLRELRGDYIPLNPETAQEKIEELISHLPNLELVHDEQQEASINMYYDDEGNISFDTDQLNNAVNDPQAYNDEYQRYLQLMQDIREGKVSQELLNTDPNKRGLTLQDLELIMKFNG